MSGRHVKRGLLILLVILLLPGVGWVYLQARQARAQTNPANARKQEKPIPVRTEPVAEKETEFVIGGTALTIPAETAVIRLGNASRKATDPIFDVVVKARRVEEGALVQAGQVLFELDDEIYRHMVKEHEAALEAARAELERVKQEVSFNPKLREIALASAEERLSFYKEEVSTRREAVDMAENLYRKGALGMLEWLDFRLKFAQARFDLGEGQRLAERAKAEFAMGDSGDKAKLARATANLDSARIDLDAAHTKVERCRIKSPLEGVVTNVSAVAGQVVADNSILAEVIKVDPIFVRMDFPQERLDEVSLGHKAEVVLDAFPKETFQGTVVRILPQVNANLRVLPVLIALNNPKQRIKPGVSGFVRLRQTRKAVAVPAQAVLQHGGKAMVFRVEDGKARIREVTTGPMVEAGLVEVQHGLAAGDEIVVFHNFYANSSRLLSTNGYLQDNDPIDPNWRRWARRE